MDNQAEKKLQFIPEEPNDSKINGELSQSQKLSDIPVAAATKTIKKRLRRKRNKWTLIITFLSLVLIIIFITIAYLVAKQTTVSKEKLHKDCKDSGLCSLTLIETIPSVLKFKPPSPVHDSISTHWRQLISIAEKRIDILSSYWSLKSSDVIGGPYKEAKIGELILSDLHNAASRGIKIRIVQNQENGDTEDLAKEANVEVRTLDVTRLLKAGIIHTKAIIVDNKHIYVGSANFDWRSHTEVKELGVVMYECKCPGEDINKIFEINWLLAKKNSQIPSQWPIKYHTNANKDNPMVVNLKDRSPIALYWSASPPPFNAPRRTSDIDAILNLISTAKKFVYIAVMDYMAAIIYSSPNKYWGVIDNALREAVYNRGITVHMLISMWEHTRKQQFGFLKSLQAFGEMEMNGTLEVRMFEMPCFKIPYTRVNHNKYMVTDNAAFVSTSNWSGDYFISTAGVSLVLSASDIHPIKTPNNASTHEQIKQVFIRDWESSYAKALNATHRNFKCT